MPKKIEEKATFVDVLFVYTLNCVVATLCLQLMHNPWSYPVLILSILMMTATIFWLVLTNFQVTRTR